jgi:lysophospholipase L1-like esterase
MKHILCFGDSNTWGYIPATQGDRFPYAVRYPGVLQAKLGPGFRVIEEGLNGRMTAWDDPLNADRNALRQIDSVLESHRPLDFIVIMLGTNDMKHYMHLEALDSALAHNALLDRIEGYRCGPVDANGRGRPQVLLIAPPLVVESPSPYGRLFEGGIPKSLEFSSTYRDIANKRNCLFLDASKVASTSNRDGIHLEVESHRALGEAVAGILLKVA